MTLCERESDRTSCLLFLLPTKWEKQEKINRMQSSRTMTDDFACVKERKKKIVRAHKIHEDENDLMKRNYCENCLCYCGFRSNDIWHLNIKHRKEEEEEEEEDSWTSLSIKTYSSVINPFFCPVARSLFSSSTAADSMARISCIVSPYHSSVQQNNCRLKLRNKRSSWFIIRFSTRVCRPNHLNFSRTSL